MWYIGSKLKLIGFIQDTIEKYCGENLQDKVFCDLFAGTGIVGKSFSPLVKQTIANDLEYYSYIANYVNLHGYDTVEVDKYIQDINKIKPNYDCIFAQYYGEGGSAGRLFYTRDNAAKIGAARDYIESLFKENKISQDTYYALVLSIINGSDDVANCTGVYGAYLKNFKPSAHKPVIFKKPEIFISSCKDGEKNEVYLEDANILIKKIKGDILYLDPPYNTRQYGSNYHILNYIAHNEYPDTTSISGVSEHNKSKYSSKRDAGIELDELIKNADFEWIFLSYNNEGIIPFEEIKSILSKYGDYHVAIREHQRYKADSNRRNLAGRDTTDEYIHVLHKTVVPPQKSLSKLKLNKVSASAMKRESIRNINETVVSPMNYMGGKKRLLKTLFENFPDEIDNFVDLFCGGCTVGINANANKIIFNDNMPQLINLYKAFKNTPIEDIISHIEKRIDEYQLSETNEESFKQLRAYYNKTHCDLDLFVLAAFSFNNQIRFNGRGEFNVPFGRNRRFNGQMRENLIGFVNALQKKNISFYASDFKDIQYEITQNDFVYCDPPYLVSVATYNAGWNEEKEHQLLDMLSDFNKRGIKFALSNVLKNKGQENTILSEWITKNGFQVIHIDKNYSNCYYQRKEKDSKSDEVLILNYNVDKKINNLIQEENLFTEIEKKDLSDIIEGDKSIDKIELNHIYNCDCLDGLKKMEDCSVDLVVTSPPYDQLRKYTDNDKGDCEWNFEIFKPIAKELARVIKNGGVIVWNVGDSVIDESETGTSFRQALYFMDECGLKLHDTMIYEKNSSSHPSRITSKRYTQIFEYMFVFTKGKIRKDITLIADKRNKWAGWTNWGQHSEYDADGKLKKSKNIKPIAEFSLRTNIWKYSVSFNDKTGHPAVFPEKLAEDNILSWTNEGDVVLDPFMGSGTTAKMAQMNHRNYIGFERNTTYYENSLQRVRSFEGKFNENLSGTTVDDEYLQINIEDDKEENGKNKLWNKLIEELNVYFNEQSLGILKNLRFTFNSKSNDERVKKVLNEEVIEPEYLEPINEDNSPTIEDIEAHKDIILKHIIKQ